MSSPAVQRPGARRSTRLSRRKDAETADPSEAEQEDQGKKATAGDKKRVLAKCEGGDDAAKSDPQGDGAPKATDGEAASQPPPAKRTRGPAAKKKPAGAAASSKSGPSRDMELSLMAQGYTAVGGADEAGRGPLAGPVVAAVVVLPPPSDASWQLPPGLNDSKALTEEEREEVYERLTTDPRVKWAVSVIGHEEIDRINILQAALGAMRESAVQLLAKQAQHGHNPNGDGGPAPALDFLLIDGNRMPTGLPVAARTVVKGDATCCNIAAASCIAKVTRDRLMLQLDEQYPQYGFAQHKGYGVPAHMEAIRTHGPCAVHRRSFEPIKSMTGWSREAMLAKERKARGEQQGGDNGKEDKNGAQKTTAKKGARKGKEVIQMEAGQAEAEEDGKADLTQAEPADAIDPVHAPSTAAAAKPARTAGRKRKQAAKQREAAAAAEGDAEGTAKAEAASVSGAATAVAAVASGRRGPKRGRGAEPTQVAAEAAPAAAADVDEADGPSAGAGDASRQESDPEKQPQLLEQQGQQQRQDQEDEGGKQARAAKARGAKAQKQVVAAQQKTRAEEKDSGCDSVAAAAPAAAAEEGAQGGVATGDGGGRPRAGANCTAAAKAAAEPVAEVDTAKMAPADVAAGLRPGRKRSSSRKAA